MNCIKPGTGNQAADGIGRLVVTRGGGEDLVIGDPDNPIAVVTIRSIRGSRVRVGIDCARDGRIFRRGRAGDSAREGGAAMSHTPMPSRGGSPSPFCGRLRPFEMGHPPTKFTLTIVSTSDPRNPRDPLYRLRLILNRLLRDDGYECVALRLADRDGGPTG